MALRQADEAHPTSDGEVAAQPSRFEGKLFRWAFTLIFMAVLVITIVSVFFIELEPAKMGSLMALTGMLGAPILLYWFHRQGSQL